MAEPILRLRGVDKVYGQEIQTQVLFQVDLEILPGDFVVILGKSGSGKTTLLNLIGLLDTASAGSVEINGQAVEALGQEALARLRRDFLGFIFQFHHLLPDFNVLENVLMPCRIRGARFEEQARARAVEMLERVGLGDKLQARPGQLSGGQQQRVAVVRAFSNSPRLVLADEPTGSLDSRTTRQVLDLMSAIQAESGTAFVMVTHDEATADVANRIIELEDGRIVSDRRR